MNDKTRKQLSEKEILRTIDCLMAKRDHFTTPRHEQAFTAKLEMYQQMLAEHRNGASAVTS